MLTDEPLRHALIAASRKAAVKNRSHFDKNAWLPNILFCLAGGMIAFGFIRRSRTAAAAALLLGTSGFYAKRALDCGQRPCGPARQNDAADESLGDRVSLFDEASSESFPASDSPARSNSRIGDFAG